MVQNLFWATGYNVVAPCRRASRSLSRHRRLADGGQQVVVAVNAQLLRRLNLQIM